jgi:hypothetical protein
MERFEYVAWIVDHRLPSDDPDAESSVVYAVSAAFAEAAQEWGDTLAKLAFPPGRAQEFSWSLVVPISESLTPGLEQLPVIPYGLVPLDAEIA